MGNPTVWTTRDGRKIPLAEMDTDHLKNTLAMIRRKGAVSPGELADMFHGLSMVGGDGAYDALTQEIDTARVSSWIEPLEDELMRRGVRV